MSEEKRKISRFERYLTEEIGIEFKACLYFFCILFYYCVFRMAEGSMEASIPHMAEMIFLTYGMGYAQVYLFSNFDEGEQLRAKEWGCLFLCVGIYTGASWLGGWFERSLPVSAGFALYMAFAYICAFLIYKFKREIDARILNEDLKAFQGRGMAEHVEHTRTGKERE